MAQTPKEFLLRLIVMPWNGLAVVAFQLLCLIWDIGKDVLPYETVKPSYLIDALVGLDVPVPEAKQITSNHVFVALKYFVTGNYPNFNYKQDVNAIDPDDKREKLMGYIAKFMFPFNQEDPITEKRVKNMTNTNVNGNDYPVLGSFIGRSGRNLEELSYLLPVGAMLYPKDFSDLMLMRVDYKGHTPFVETLICTICSRILQGDMGDHPDLGDGWKTEKGYREWAVKYCYKAWREEMLKQEIPVTVDGHLEYGVASSLEERDQLVVEWAKRVKASANM